MLRTVLGLACLAGLLTLVGCGSYEPSQQPTTSVVASAPYILRPTDQVRVQVYNESSVTGEYAIDSAGFISVPLAGRIKAAGLTTLALEKSIAAKLNRGILKDAGVNVQVSGYSPFYIRGEVKKPGEFPYRPGMTVADAVALAGGYTYRANETKIFVRPAGVAQEHIYTLDTDAPVSPGDNIRIPERFF